MHSRRRPLFDGLLHVYLLLCFLWIGCLRGVVMASSQPSDIVDDDAEERIVRKVVRECSASWSRIACFSEKGAAALERAMNWDVTLFEGIRLVRDTNATIPLRARTLLRGWDRLKLAVRDFLDTHAVSVDLATARDVGSGRKDKKKKKKEKKYMQYAMMVLLGIFGLTGPLVMNTLAVISAKALIASKMALLIAGSAALKKIFEKDHSTIKVHAITEDEHDRIFGPVHYEYVAPIATYEAWPKA